MNIYRKLLFFCEPLVLVLLISCAVYSPKNNADVTHNSIVGKWVSINRSGGRLGGVYIFGKDQNMIVFFGAIIDYNYEIEGQEIFETYPNGTQTKSNYSINGKILTKVQISPQNSTSECKLEMKKLGNDVDDSQSIIGNWTYQDKTGAWTIQEYTADGRAQLCVPLVTEKGKYHLINNELTIEIKGKEQISRKIRIDKNCLVLMPNDKHSEEIYERFN